MVEIAVVPMVVGLCLDMCAVFLLSKSFSPIFLEHDEIKKLYDASKKESERVKDFCSKMDENKVTILEGKFVAKQLSDLNFNMNKILANLFNLDVRKTNENRISLIILLFGISLMIFSIV